MENIVFMSIKEQHINRILNKSKNHEFRTKIPKEKVNYILVYVPTPVKELRYLLKVRDIISTPNKIKIDGYGNDQFNSEKGIKYAYPIEKVYKLNKSMKLQELKEKYNFTAPQSFAYGNKYQELVSDIEKIGFTKIY